MTPSCSIQFKINNNHVRISCIPMITTVVVHWTTIKEKPAAPIRLNFADCSDRLKFARISAKVDEPSLKIR